MKKLALITTALVALNFSAPVFADDASMPPSAMEKAISQLPHDEAEDFRDTLQSAHEENASLYDKAQQLRTQLHDILSADKFDKSAFAAKSKELRKLHDKIHANLDDAFGDALSKLPANDRQTLLTAMEDQHQAMKQAAKQAE